MGHKKLYAAFRSFSCRLASGRFGCMKKLPFGLERIDPLPVSAKGFNNGCQIPYGLTVQHICSALSDYIDFLTFINQQLISKKIPRLETFIMPAGFSSIVGEFMNVRLPIYCNSLVKNRYHNGHPDLIPAGHFPDDAVQHDTVGIEIKGSRNRSGWQGHNPERQALGAIAQFQKASAVERGCLTTPPRLGMLLNLRRVEGAAEKFSGVGEK